MTEKILEPTPEERAYNEGWNAYFSNLGVNMNPYSDSGPEETLFESFIDGWSTAQRGDKIVEDDS